MVCTGCGNTKAHWIRRRESTEICDGCAPDLPAPSTAGTVDRWMAYTTRNSLNPPVIPTVPQPAVEHARVLKKMEANGKLKGKQLLKHQRVLKQMERQDYYRSRGLFDDGKTPLERVNDMDNVFCETDGSVRDGSGRKLSDHCWEVVPDSQRPAEIKEVVLDKNSAKVERV